MPGARILLVEDDEILRDLLGRNLTVRGHDVSIADICAPPLLISSSWISICPTRPVGRCCAPLCGKAGSILGTSLAAARSYPSWSYLPSG